MENKPHQEMKPGDEKENAGAVNSQAPDSAPADLEQTAKTLDQEQSTGTAEKSGKSPNEKEEDANASEDPGLVARMTAKGALSGF